MELTDEAIHDAIEMVLDTFAKSVTNSMLRPSGLLRVADKNMLLPTGEEAKALKAALALADIRQATTPGADYTSRWIFMFLCGYAYEMDGSLEGIFREALHDFTQVGFGGLTGHQITTFKNELVSNINNRAEKNDVSDKAQLNSASWVIGKRVRNHVADGEQLEQIFEKEWLTDERG